MEKRIISIAVLVAALSIAYYVIVYLPVRENAELVKRQQEVVNLQTCLSSADTDFYDKVWKTYCKGDYKYCELPKELIDYVNTRRHAQRDYCYKVKPQL